MPKHLTIEEAEKRCSDMRKGQTWGHALDKYWFVCESHGVYLQQFSNHQAGAGCPVCGVTKKRHPTRLTIAEAERRCPDMVKGQVWDGVDSKYWFECKEHGRYQQCFGPHDKRGQTCPTCRTAAQWLTIEEAERRCPDMVKGQVWNGFTTKYWFTCDKHGRYLQDFARHESSYRGCPTCGRVATADSNRLTVAEAERRCPDMVKGQVWNGAHRHKYWFMCEEHGAYQQWFLGHYHSDNGCPMCAITSVAQAISYTIEEAEACCPDMMKGQVWTYSIDKYWFVCEKHGAYLQDFRGHRRGAGCSLCNESRGEKRVASALGNLGVSFARQYRIPECKNVRCLPFDFAVTSPRLLLIEFNGQQHYESGRASWANEDSLREVQRRDRIKVQFCEENHIPLLIIPYTEIANVDSITRGFLQEQGVL